jgi:hypothetical protein
MEKSQLPSQDYISLSRSNYSSTTFALLSRFSHGIEQERRKAGKERVGGDPQKNEGGSRLSISLRTNYI